MKVLGIDIGTTSVSLSVLDGESGEQVKAVTVGTTVLSKRQSRGHDCRTRK